MHCGWPHEYPFDAMRLVFSGLLVKQVTITRLEETVGCIAPPSHELRWREQATINRGRKQCWRPKYPSGLLTQRFLLNHINRHIMTHTTNIQKRQIKLTQSKWKRKPEAALEAWLPNSMSHSNPEIWAAKLRENNTVCFLHINTP